MSGNYKNLQAYDLSFNLAIDIYLLSKTFPVEERFAMTNQIRRSSRSVCVNFVEGYYKRQYPKHFSSKMSDADMECNESIVWLEFALKFQFISHAQYQDLKSRFESLGRLLNYMSNNPGKFAPRKLQSKS